MTWPPVHEYFKTLNSRKQNHLPDFPTEAFANFPEPEHRTFDWIISINVRPINDAFGAQFSITSFKQSPALHKSTHSQFIRKSPKAKCLKKTPSNVSSYCIDMISTSYAPAGYLRGRFRMEREIGQEAIVQTTLE